MKYMVWICLLATLVLFGCDTQSQLDVSKVKEELEKKAVQQAEYKPVITGDVIVGKKLAESSCARCHGINGVAARSGSPFIAGVPQDYLTRSMIAYEYGSRKHDDMLAVVQSLSPEDIRNVSAYYASLDTSWKGATIGKLTKESIITPRAIRSGKVIARRCASCHGKDGNVAHESIFPSLASMQPEYFIPALNSYFTGKRKHAIMKIFKNSLSKGEVNDLAAYYATRTPKRAPRPTKGDAAAGKVAADQCAGCHGFDGNSSNPHIPNLAGLTAKYLVKATKDYRDRGRNDRLMSDIAKKLNNRTITNIAAYFASQTPVSSTARAVNEFDPVVEGERIAKSCQGCHGEGGDSTKPGIPSLTGLDAKYLVAATQSYQQNLRVSKTMETMVSHLSDTSIEKVAFYYATREPAPVKKTVSGNPNAGEEISKNCEACHGKNGVSTDPKNPSLAGQDAAYLVSAIKEYANGKRAHDGMKNAVGELSANAVKNLAAYYAVQKPVKPHTVLPIEPAIIIEQRCARCHGDRGYSTEAGKPRLAGQTEAYLIVAIKEYQEGKRKSSTMHAISDILSMIEIKAIAAYYSQQ